MDGNGLFVCLAPSWPHIVRSAGSPGATPLQGHYFIAEEAKPVLIVSGSPWWSRAGPITV